MVNSCQHQWKPSHNNLGLFAWKCEKCQAIKEADPTQDCDREMLLIYAQKLNQQFYEALEAWESSSKAEKKPYRDKVHALYWVTRISYLRAGIKDSICQSEDLEQQFPCPPELQLIYSLLKPSAPPPWDKLAEPINEIPSGNDVSVRKTSSTSSNIPSGNDVSVRKNRSKGLGTGWLVGREIYKNGNLYYETWFHYEIKEKGKWRSKSKYVSKNKVAKIIDMNNRKLPVCQIINAINSKKS